jgi:hypothetical protein
MPLMPVELAKIREAILQKPLKTITWRSKKIKSALYPQMAAEKLEFEI